MALFQNQIDKGMDQLEQLSGRERLLVSVGGLAGIALFGFIMAYLIGGSLDNMDANNRDLEIKLERIIQKQGEYLSARGKVKQIKSHIAKNTVERLLPYLDNASKGAQLVIRSMNPVTVEQTKKNKQVKESSVRVEINKAPLAAVARFFESIERSGKVVKVRQLRMRPNFQDPKLVNVSAVVSTFALTK